MATCSACGGEIPDTAIVCMHCRRTTDRGRAVRNAHRSRLWGRAWKTAAVLFVGLALFTAWGMTLPQRSLADRAKESCEREFSGDTDAQQRCEIAIMLKALNDQQLGKLARAARDAN